MEAKLFLSGKESIPVFDFDFGFTQYTDDTGKTTGNPTGGTINMVVAASKDTTLIDWMLSNKALKSGRIEVDVKKKVIEFTNAECIQYHESFSHMGGDQPMSISFTISVESMKIDGKEFTQKRKK